MSYICMVLDGDYPNDIRVRKEAEALIISGKKVLVVCPHKKNNLKNENINGVEVFRIGKNYTLFKKAVFDIIESVFNINPLFFLGLRKVFKNYTIDFLHVHDLPLASTGYLFKNRVKKILLDLHENYPEAIKTWFAWRTNPLIKLKNVLFMNPKLWQIKENKYCEKYDVVICVIEEMKNRIIGNNINIDSKKLWVVSNQEKIEFEHNFDLIKENSFSKNNFFITYVGGFGPHRGLDTVIEAMSLIIKKIPHAKLILVGKGSKDVEQKLKKIVHKLNLYKNVDFIGYKPFNEVFEIMKNSSVNIIPHKSNAHTNNTIPHKIFQIMMSKSILLVSTCIPLKRIVEKYDAGIVFEAGDSLDLADKICLINENYDFFKKTKAINAYNAVKFKGENWNNESIKLINLYNNI